MKTIGNIIWIVFGGFVMAALWCVVGLLQCVTIIGIPVGVQAFKLAGLALWPFGKNVVYGGGAGSFLLNLIWLVLGGFVLAIGHFALGLIYCVTIIGIPFGMQYFKLAKLALMPFGAAIT